MSPRSTIALEGETRCLAGSSGCRQTVLLQRWREEKEVFRLEPSCNNTYLAKKGHERGDRVCHRSQLGKGSHRSTELTQQSDL
ncbi:unnamed protein product [Peronospora belbahrii]|uniref:Uncharacterized protein n=1 Tax=Peronospora belbahrii TaxID=622444 RepID=A0AAU9L679_9STRA|nr:unnamed protein product [Peronospora belbahrii]